jgi:hypothetical protein
MCAQCDPRRVKSFERGVWQAERLGDLQKFVVGSPLFPLACVVAFFAFMSGAVWGVNVLVDTLL